MINETVTNKKNTDHSPIEISPVASSRIQEVDLDNPGFGVNFSDHMAVVRYEKGQWQRPAIKPFEKMQFSPALAALHYGQSIFEGMKAFKDSSGTIRMFRPEHHLNRLNMSCRRMCIPELDVGELFDTLKTLLKLDRDWIPVKRGNALYIRPLIFGTDNCLGVRPSETYTALIITSPVGAYYDEGLDPVRLTTDKEYVRSVRGGTGSAKTAGNYGATLKPARKAKNNGFTQVLWLDAIEQKYVEEVGTMNIFFKFKDRLVTPPAEGTILPGVTRRSVIELAKHWGIPVEKRRIAIDEVFAAHADGSLEEVFGTGTAAVVSPVGEIVHEGDSLTTDMEKAGPFTQKMYDAITGIQYGEREDLFNWMVGVS
ncbi:MAG: branched-chain amino acid aminotransferase [Balneolaceae bacterium]